MNEAKHVSRIIGLIDLGNASANALCELDSVTTLQKRAQANADDIGVSDQSDAIGRSIFCVAIFICAAVFKCAATAVLLSLWSAQWGKAIRA